jgi:hypothetical protein
MVNVLNPGGSVYGVNRLRTAFARFAGAIKISRNFYIFVFIIKQDVSISTLDGDFWPDSFPPCT